MLNRRFLHQNCLQTVSCCGVAVICRCQCICPCLDLWFWRWTIPTHKDIDMLMALTIGVSAYGLIQKWREVVVGIGVRLSILNWVSVIPWWLDPYRVPTGHRYLQGQKILKIVKSGKVRKIGLPSGRKCWLVFIILFYFWYSFKAYIFPSPCKLCARKTWGG